MSEQPNGTGNGLKIRRCDYIKLGGSSPLSDTKWRCGVIGNTRDSDSLVLGSRPNGAANMASSYNGSIGDFESFGVGPIPALAANKLKNNVVDANIGGVRYA